MSRDFLTDGEAKLLHCLFGFYREFGPGAAPAIKELGHEAGLERFELDNAVRALRNKELIEYWELQPAVRLTESGLRLALRISEEGAG